MQTSDCDTNDIALTVVASSERLLQTWLQASALCALCHLIDGASYSLTELWEYDSLATKIRGLIFLSLCIFLAM